MKYERLTDKQHRYKKCVDCKYRNCQYCDDDIEYAKEAHNRLAELEDKIEQGMLIELPCKVGDTFWYLSVAGYIEEDKIANFSLYGEFFTGERVVTKLYKNYLGRTWFLTREGAEKRLKELQNV